MAETLKRFFLFLFLQFAKIHAVGNPTNPKPITEIFFIFHINSIF